MRWRPRFAPIQDSAALRENYGETARYKWGGITAYNGVVVLKHAIVVGYRRAEKHKVGHYGWRKLDGDGRVWETQSRQMKIDRIHLMR